MHVQTNRMALELRSAIVHTPYYISISTAEENVSMRYRLALRSQSSQPNATLPRQLIPFCKYERERQPHSLADPREYPHKSIYLSVVQLELYTCYNHVSNTLSMPAIKAGK